MSSQPPPSIKQLDEWSLAYASNRDPAIREKLVRGHQRLVRALASRFRNSGEPLDDLIQVGNIGLINAVDRFEPSHGTRFSTYAAPNILGEIRRYFRDKTVSVRVPRWMQEMNVTAKRVTATMTSELGRAPSVTEVAQRMNVSEAHLREAIAAHESTKLVSLDAVLQGSDPSVDTTLKELIGAIDSEMANIEEFADLRAALSKLSERERIIIELRFFDEETQAVIANKLGISQMHVSRIQSKALARLREVMKSNDIDGYLTVS